MQGKSGAGDVRNINISIHLTLGEALLNVAKNTLFSPTGSFLLYKKA